MACGMGIMRSEWSAGRKLCLLSGLEAIMLIPGPREANCVLSLSLLGLLCSLRGHKERYILSGPLDGIMLIEWT